MSKEKQNNGGSIVELPLITQGDQILIDASLLHSNLQVTSKFYDWINRRIKDFGFEKGKDFYSNLRKSTGGRVLNRLNSWTGFVA